MIEKSSMKILLPVDGSLCSLAAAPEVAYRPWPKGSEVKILHVAERPLIDPQVAQTLPEGVLTHLQNTACYALEKAVVRHGRGRATGGRERNSARESQEGNFWGS